LPRIVTLHDFTVEASQDTTKKSDIPVVNYSVKAKTYRYVGADDAANTEVGAAVPPQNNPPSQGGTN
jgi:type IV pilus assembly protein PilO